MTVDIGSEGTIRFTEVYEPIIMRTESGAYSFCERDGDIEIRRLEDKEPILPHRMERLRRALQWCSAASDFDVSGKARRGWLKLCKPLL